MRYKGKTYLIAGGSSGIGLATAQLLAKKGAGVILVSGNEEKLANALAGLDCAEKYAVCCDLGNPENVGTVFERLQEKGIVLDGMVYCAGIAPLCLLKDNTPELMTEVFSVNLFSFIEMSRYFYRETYAHNGSRIVAVSSITAHGAGYRQTLYGASKAAMVSAVKLMSKELMNRDIRINCISPGVVDTPILEELRAASPGLEENLKKNQILGVIPPEAVASAIVHMLGEGSDYRTGTEQTMDAGFYLK